MFIFRFDLLFRSWFADDGDLPHIDFQSGVGITEVESQVREGCGSI